jgi:NADPH:quinone reductase-like Zn-dependent oxidoreductase
VKAVRLHELGGVPQVDEIDAPPGPGFVRVAAAALNPIDVSIANGRFYGGTPPMPYVVGSEAVGTSEDGGRVWLRGRQLLAEAVDPGSSWVFPVPAGVDDATALGCGIAGLTAWLALAWRAQVQPGETVLVLGASGTLGAVAVQAARVLGAGRVIGAARRTELVPQSADEAFDLTTDGELPAASLIVDALWGEPLERALAAAPVGVRVVHLGQSAGPSATLLSAWVRGKTATILGHSLFDVPFEVALAGYRELCGHAREGRIAFDTETFPLERIGEAWARQSSGSPGAKIVISLT